MSQQIKEYEKLIAEKSDITPAEIWAKIQDFLYRKNSDGTFVLKDEKKVLNWANILLKIGKLIALLVQRIEIHNQPKPEPVEPKPEPTKTEKTTPKE